MLAIHWMASPRFGLDRILKLVAFTAPANGGKDDGWNTRPSFWEGLFSWIMLVYVSFRESAILGAFLLKGIGKPPTIFFSPSQPSVK